MALCLKLPLYCLLATPVTARPADLQRTGVRWNMCAVNWEAAEARGSSAISRGFVFEFVVFLEFYKQFVVLNSNKQNDGTTEREI